MEEAEGNPTRGIDLMFSQNNSKIEEDTETEEKLQGRISKTAGQRPTAGMSGDTGIQLRGDAGKLWGHQLAQQCDLPQLCP